MNKAPSKRYLWTKIGPVKNSALECLEVPRALKAISRIEAARKLLSFKKCSRHMSRTVISLHCMSSFEVSCKAQQRDYFWSLQKIKACQTMMGGVWKLGNTLACHFGGFCTWVPATTVLDMLYTISAEFCTDLLRLALKGLWTAIEDKRLGQRPISSALLFSVLLYLFFTALSVLYSTFRYHNNPYCFSRDKCVCAYHFVHGLSVILSVANKTLLANAIKQDHLLKYRKLEIWTTK